MINILTQLTFNKILDGWGFKDFVQIPEDIEPGAYVMSFRWDSQRTPQIWSNCANIEVVQTFMPGPSSGPKCFGPRQNLLSGFNIILDIQKDGAFDQCTLCYVNKINCAVQKVITFKYSSAVWCFFISGILQEL